MAENDYNDIIDMPHHQSKTRNHMSIHDRAAQFSPFAALTGYDGAIKETVRLTDTRIELDETKKAALDERIGMIREHLSEQQEIEITFFQPDEKKSGGAYLTLRGVIKKIDEYEKRLVMQSGEQILIDDIAEITGELFSALDGYFA